MNQPTNIRQVKVRALRAIAVFTSLLLSSCSMMQTDNFTFQAELPDDFLVTPVAYYESLTEKKCTIKKEIQGSQLEDSKKEVFKVPLSDTTRGCKMTLKSVFWQIEGKWGPRDIDIGFQRSGLTIRDVPSETTRVFPASGPLVFQGQCKWYFRTAGPYRYIVKILECRGLDADGIVEKSLPGGSIPRDQLPGKTVVLNLRMAEEEAPYYGPYWIKTDKGWKPCKGNWETNNEERCVTPPQFRDFKMPDGRNCTVYPNCTE
ncbi:hypothetical protein ACW9H6_05655 [Pseudomonas sp. SDO528_S397]